MKQSTLTLRAFLAPSVVALEATFIPACQQTLMSPTETATQADVAGYAAEEHECVSLSATRVEYQDCVAGVKQRWCGTGGTLALRGACGDAGITNPVVLGMTKDGGGK